MNRRQVSNDQQLDAKSEIQETKRLAHSGNGDRNMYHHIASLPILTLVIVVLLYGGDLNLNLNLN